MITVCDLILSLRHTGVTDLVPVLCQNGEVTSQVVEKPEGGPALLPDVRRFARRMADGELEREKWKKCEICELLRKERSTNWK